MNLGLCRWWPGWSWSLSGQQAAKGTSTILSPNLNLTLEQFLIQPLCLVYYRYRRALVTG